MFVIAIDPGIVNLGVATYNTETSAFVDARCTSICSRMKDLKRDQDLIELLSSLFFDVGGELKHMMDLADVVLIEVQMKRKFITMQYILGSMLHNMGKKYHFIAPIRVKKHFGTSTGKYATNKSAAIQCAMAMYPHLFKKRAKNSKKLDDIADAILMCRWYADLREGVKRPVIKKRTKAVKAKTKKTKTKAKTKKTKTKVFRKTTM